MADLSQDLALAAEFPPAKRGDWLRLVQAALKDHPFETLVTRSYDGLEIQPLYDRAAGAAAIAGRVAGQPWQVIQRIDHPDPAAANREALHELENGATGLGLILSGAPASRGFGVSVDSTEGLQHALSGVMLDMISLRLETPPFAGRQTATMMVDLLSRSKANPAAVAIDFGLDPVGDVARTGGSPLPWPDLAQRAGDTSAELRRRGFDRSRFLRADGRPVHDAGGSEAQELAFALASAVAYLRILENGGFSPDEARRRVSFLLTADADEFLTLAKLRALRKLWARVEEVSGLTPEPAYVAAETAWRTMTARDPYVNILRATLAATAAGIGGADAVTVLPFTLALGLPDRFARRVARNLQLILLEESNLYRVADPAAGSGAIEALTTQLAQSAWALFQEIEGVGGIAEALEKDLLQKKIAATRAAREAAVAKRKDAITGVSDYPNLGEAPVTVLDVPHTPLAGPQGTFEPLPQMRLAEPFEALREKSDAMLKKTGERPKVFLANLGKPSDFTARATYAKNIYEAGGIEAVTNDGFPDRDALIEAYKASGAQLACLCSSDKVYASEVEGATAALTAAGATVHLAGRPGDHETAWNKAGVATYIYVGCDVLAILRTAHDLLDRL